MISSLDDSELGRLTWDDRLKWWEGSISLSSNVAFRLYIFARQGHTPNRGITAEARSALQRIRGLEAACRRYAAEELIGIRNSEWSDGNAVSHADFVRRLTPESVEIHESGYSEMHFGDGDLFWGHSVGIRIGPDGTFQEAVVEG